MQRKAEFQLALAGTVTDFKILSPANTPIKPISPDKWMIYGIGWIGGIIISLFYIGFVYLANNKITSYAELERNTQTPILGSIPFYTDEKMPISKLVINNHSNSVISEAIRTIRTNMQFLLPNSETAIISITSMVSGEGKTFVGINLAAAFALSNKRVILLDLDMRKPKLHEIFGQNETRRGISTLLIGKDNLKDCIKQTPIEHYHYIPAGPVPPNPSELLLSAEFESLINTVSKDYDMVILDSPPIGIVTDGVLVMKKSDLQIFVIRADYSRKVFIDNLERLHQIHQFPNLSLILNGVHRSVNSYYGYGYGYGVGYYTKKRKRRFFV
jgi:capsular exopolysaccharide synthesis family protein